MADARILVVDDERFFREAIRDVLTPAGLAIELAASGEEALEKLADPSLGVMVLDLQLPDLHGLEVFRRARRIRPELRVVILSAHTDQAYVLEALRLGAADYLAKPLHEEELELAVRRAQASFALEAGWKGLRDRIGRLERAIGTLWERADGVGALAPEELRERVVRIAAEVIGARKTSLLLVGDGPGELRVAATHGRAIPSGAEAGASAEGPAGVALARAEPILVADLARDERFPDRAGERGYESASFAVAPLVAGSQALGVLCATDRSDGPMDADDLALLRLLAQQAAWLLDRPAAPAPAEAVAVAELEEEAPPLEEIPGGDARGAALVREICEAVTAEVEPARILVAALERIGRALRAAPVSLFLATPARDALVREAEWDGGAKGDRERLPASTGLTGFVFESGGIVATDVPESDARFAAAADTPDDGAPRPLLCGPIRFRGRTLGVFRAFPEQADEASPALAELLSAALSAAVRNVLLYRSLVQTIEEVAVARREARSEP
jgi:FixJ family two-component response regulator/transcriptional regulator with GAF, ATPase, and Fis domain